MAAPIVPVVECPKVIRDYCDSFKDILATTACYKSLVALVCAAAFGVANISNIVRYFLFSPSVSAMCNFLGTPDLAGRLNRRHRRRLAALMAKARGAPQRYHYAIDDTLVDHSGKRIWGSYSWHDHSINSYINGHKILVIGLVDKKRNILIPLIWEVLHRDLSDKTNADSVAARVHEKAWQVALRLLDTVILEGLPKLALTADSWFLGDDFCTALSVRDIPFVIELKSNRIVESHGKMTVKTSLIEFFKTRVRHLISFNHKTKYASEAVLRLRNTTHSVKVVAVANHRAIDDAYFSYYACNQLTWDASKVWMHARGRWSIEVQFRELKQLFALGEAAVRSKESVEAAVSISMIALTVIRLQQLANADSSKNQYVRPISAGAIVRDLQFTSVNRSISKLALNPQMQTVKKFHSRYNQQNLNTKPAERFQMAELKAG